MNTLLVGTDATDRSRDAITFARRIAGAADVILACAVVYGTPTVSG